MTDLSPFWPIDEPWHLELPDGVLYDALARAAQARPDHPATAFYGASLSYAELLAQVDAMAGYLQTVCGVGRGDRVLIALQNSPQYVIAYYAVMRADAVVVPVNPMNKTAEIDYLAPDSGAMVAMIGSELTDIVRPLLESSLAHIIVAHYRDYVPAATPIRCRPVSRSNRKRFPLRQAGIAGRPHWRMPSGLPR